MLGARFCDNSFVPIFLVFRYLGTGTLFSRFARQGGPVLGKFFWSKIFVTTTKFNTNITENAKKQKFRNWTENFVVYKWSEHCEVFPIPTRRFRHVCIICCKHHLYHKFQILFSLKHESHRLAMDACSNMLINYSLHCC